jgi:hypothetical protein
MGAVRGLGDNNDQEMTFEDATLVEILICFSNRPDKPAIPLYR